VRVAAVPASRAEEVRQLLRARGWIDSNHRITKRDDVVLIPLRPVPQTELRELEVPLEDIDRLDERPEGRSPSEEIRERLLAEGVPPSACPVAWRRIGDIIILRLDKASQNHRPTIGRIVGEVLSAKTVVEDRSGIHGAWRVPDIRVLWGNGTETVHLEAGVRYKLDLASVMFSSGNLAARVSLPKRVPPNAVVVDLFAGIGYFSLPIASRRPSTLVYACEMNPASYRFLKENIRLNRLSNVVPLLGDCRTTSPQRTADWVLMGHFDAREYLDVAFRTLRDRGTILYHELCPKEQYPLAPIERVAEAARTAWYRVRTTRTAIVKSYAPGILHVAVEADVERETRRK
jgi:tRNA wybutosine-synthesizing protein 2